MRLINVFLIFISVIFIKVCQAQIKDYFIPSSQYFDQLFHFETETWENENGQFRIKNLVKYYRDPTGNYKKDIQSTSYRYNVPKTLLKVHQFFNISNERVIDIYFYIEGVSDELKQFGYLDDFDNNKTILKLPSSTWTDKRDKDATDYYKAEFGDLKTKYGNYPKCIVVTKYSKSINGKFKWVEKFVYKSYYAKNLGLVKTETYENGKLSKMGFGYGGTLIDNFSEYSFYLDNKWKEEAKQKQEFMSTRKETIYELKEYDFSEYTRIKSKMDDKVLSVHQKNTANNYFIEFETKLQIDTDGKINNAVEVLRSDGKIDSEFSNVLKEIRISPKTKYGLTVNAKMNERYNVSRTSQKFTIKTNQNSIKLIQGDPVAYEKFANNIESEIKQSVNPSGTYSLVYSKSSMNERISLDIKYTDFKGLGGSSSALFSVLIPGLGNHFVNGGKGSMLGQNASPWVTTIGTLALVGSGIGLEFASQNNYELYHQSTVQADIDKYYEAANSQYKTGYALIGIGAGLWIADIIWTASRGAKNKKEEKLIKGKLNIAFYPASTTKGLAMAMTIKIK